MTMQQKAEGSALIKADPDSPCIRLFDVSGERIAIKAGTIFNGVESGAADVFVAFPAGHPVAGTDYVIVADGGYAIEEALGNPLDNLKVLGGFHFAPGGNAKAREGGDSTPAINPCSIWDRNFRPACPDPRGMALIDGPRGKFWCDIYLLGKEHLRDGTSKYNVTIADGDDAPQKPDGGYFEELDYPTAVKVYAHHGKQLLSAEESFAAYIGGKEKTSCENDPKVTKWDAARVSRFGINQPFGAMLQWGHDGDPDEPRPSIFGGSWIYWSLAGSRCANLGDWPEISLDDLGARGRSDHLQLG